MIFSNRLRWALLVLRIALGAVFAYAAYVKLTTPWELFAGAIADYKLLPAWAVNPLARTLPWAELLIGLVLAGGILLRAAAACVIAVADSIPPRAALLLLRTASTACSLLLLVFFSLMVRADVLHQEISCGCFGPGELISWKTLLRDGSLLAASLAVTWLSFLRKAPSAPIPTSQASETTLTGQ
jgi:hypothetical protein